MNSARAIQIQRYKAARARMGITQKPRLVVVSRWSPAPYKNEPPVIEVEGNYPSDPTIAETIQIVAADYGAPIEDMLSERRFGRAVEPRQVAMYLARRVTPFSMPRIGRSFDRDHTTVIHAIRKIESRMASDAPFRDRVNGLLRRLTKQRSILAYWGA